MNRIKALRKARGLTLEQLGELVGTTGTQLQRLEAGKRKLTDKWIFRISEALGVQPAEVFGEAVAAPAVGLPLRGDVEAGVWRESDVLDELRDDRIPWGADPRYPEDNQYAFVVQGTSMNKRFPPGTFIVCVPWDEVGRTPKDGDVVVVERRRAGLVETTVKKIVSKGKSVTLTPESDDPRWQDSIPLHNGDDEIQVSIKALVVGKYEQL